MELLTVALKVLTKIIYTVHATKNQAKLHHQF